MGPFWDFKIGKYVKHLTPVSSEYIKAESYFLRQMGVGSGGKVPTTRTIWYTVLGLIIIIEIYEWT